MTDTDGGAAAVRDVPLLTVLRSSALSQYPCFAALFPLKGDAPFSSLPQRLEKLYGEICGELGGQPMQCRALQVCFSSLSQDWMRGL